MTPTVLYTFVNLTKIAASGRSGLDGVTDSLTTDLSRIGGSFVIGRNTAFTYKGRRVDLKQIGRELNIRYILGGSVQRAGARMRVNVQTDRRRARQTSLGGAFRQVARPIFSTCRTKSSRAWQAR